MSPPSSLQLQTILVGGAQIHLQNVRLSDDILLDELHLEGGDIRVDLPATPEEQGRIATGEALFRAIISEPNLNRILDVNVPSGAPVRNLRIALFSGKI